MTQDLPQTLLGKTPILEANVTMPVLMGIAEQIVLRHPQHEEDLRHHVHFKILLLFQFMDHFSSKQ
jgi:hypothetical protein